MPKPVVKFSEPESSSKSELPNESDTATAPGESDLPDEPDTIAQTIIIPKGTIKRKQGFVVEIPYQYRDEPVVVVIIKKVEDPVRSHDPFIELLETEKANEKPKIGSCKSKICPTNPNSLGLNVADDKPLEIIKCLQKCGPAGWDVAPIGSDEEIGGGSEKCGSKCRAKNKLQLCDDISQKPVVVDEGTSSSTKPEGKEVKWDLKEDKEPEEEEEEEEETEESEAEKEEEPEEEEEEESFVESSSAES